MNERRNKNQFAGSLCYQPEPIIANGTGISTMAKQADYEILPVAITNEKGQKRSCATNSAILLLCQKLIDSDINKIRYQKKNPIKTIVLENNRPVSFCKKSKSTEKPVNPVSVNFLFFYRARLLVPIP